MVRKTLFDSKAKIYRVFTLVLAVVAALVLAACAPATTGETNGDTDNVEAEDPIRIGVVLDTGGENDRSFNEYTLQGATNAAEEIGGEIDHVVSEAETDFARNIQNFIDEEYDMIVTVGFLMGEATAQAAVDNPDVNFVIIDVAYDSFNCPVELEEGQNCYEVALPNVTSLMFAEDEVGYLAGVLAGCVTETNVIGTVSGQEIPPVVRFVEGFQTGATDYNPDVETLNVYIPDFNDPATGRQAGEAHIEQGADIIFGVGGNTGNGGLLAAHEAGLLGIGVDVDQYFTYPEVQASLLTSATKNMDVATAQAVQDFAAGELEPGVRLATVANGGVGLAPYHDQEENVPDECRTAVEEAREGLAAGEIDTGYTP